MRDSFPTATGLFPKLLPTASDAPPWRLLYFFALYRLALGGLLLFLTTVFGDALSLNNLEQNRVFLICLAFILQASLSIIIVKAQRPRFSLQLAFQVGTDIAVITPLTYFSGGIQSNLGLLLLISLAATSLITRSRIAYFYAALASISILLEHTYSVLTHEAAVAQYLQAGVLSIAYFAIAWLAHTLSRYAVASERLAKLRGIDLSSMAEANRLMIQDMPDGVLVVDERGIVRQSNPSAARLLGQTFSADQPPLLSHHSPLLDAMFAAWRQNHALGNEVVRLPQTNSLVRVRFLPVQRDSFWGAVIVLEDMQRAQEQAQQVKLAALGRLTANIAHEVRNPLSSISYAAELLLENQHDATQERLSRIILDNTARLNRIVQDVMQLNRRDRINSDQIDLTKRLPHFVDELCQTKRLPPEIFALSTPPECLVYFDRGHLDQVLWNLCQNALRYSQSMAGSVSLHAFQQSNGRMALEISDDGPGVAPETAAKLFEPFFTTNASGTGLGLYIARELCEANGATLEYRQPPEGGACFRITFGAPNEP